MCLSQFIYCSLIAFRSSYNSTYICSSGLDMDSLVLNVTVCYGEGISTQLFCLDTSARDVSDLKRMLSLSHFHLQSIFFKYTFWSQLKQYPSLGQQRDPTVPLVSATLGARAWDSVGACSVHCSQTLHTQICSEMWTEYREQHKDLVLLFARLTRASSISPGKHHIVQFY